MTRFLIVLCVFVGCSHYTTIELNSLYKVLRVDDRLLLNHHFITLQSLKTKDTVYAVSQIVATANNDRGKSMLIKENLTIRISLSAYERLLLVDRSGTRLNGAICVTSSTGRTIIRMDTLIVPVFESNEIDGLYIKSECVY